MLSKNATADRYFSLCKSVKRTNSDNNSVSPAGSWVDVFRQPCAVLDLGVPKILRPIRKAQILNTVVSLILVNVVNPHVSRDFAVVPNPNESVKQWTKSIQADLSVGAGSGTIIPSDVLAATTNALAPGFPKQLPTSVVKCLAEFFFARQFSYRRLHSLLRNCVMQITPNPQMYQGGS